VLLQSTFRSNFAIIGLSLATTLGGEPAAAVASLASAFILPIFNILGVIALSLFVQGAGGEKTGFRSIMKSILKNPMVMGAAAGLCCLLLREGQTALWSEPVFTLKEDLPFVFTALNNIKSMTTPLALIILGAQFRFSAVKGMFRQIVVGTAWRIVIAPLIGVCGAALLCSAGLFAWGSGEYATLLALLGSPAAVSSAVMAVEMGSDEQLATQLVVWSSVGSVLTIFAGVCILMLGGFIV
jgi:predicted permease